MSYNILAITSKEPDWVKLKNSVFKADSALEMFPINENDGKFYLGISIPSSKINSNTNEDFNRVVSSLQNDYSFQLFDLYTGKYIDDSSIEETKANIFG